MVGIVLASHGAFAEGIKESGQMIFGPQENVATAVSPPTWGLMTCTRSCTTPSPPFDDQEHVLFLVDLWGGTPFNQVSRIVDGGDHKDWVAVTGLSLPMLVSAYGARMGAETAADVAKEIYAEARDGVKVKPESLQPVEAAPAAAAAAVATTPTGSIPEGTVLGDGHLKIVLARVDTRLLHGQVATTWTKMTGPDRIIVCSDAVAHDELRKNLITQAAPPGIKANVCPVSKLIEIARDPRFSRTSALLLFEFPQDVVRVIEGGVPLEHINVGSMAHSAGKIAINGTVSIDGR